MKMHGETIKIRNTKINIVNQRRAKFRSWKKKKNAREHKNEALYVTLKAQVHEHNWKELGGGGRSTKCKDANFRCTRSSLLASVFVILFQYANLYLTKLKCYSNKLSITKKEKVNERARPNILSNWENTQDDQKVSMHLMITIQKVTGNVQSVSRQCPETYWHPELCSRRPFSV